MSGLNSNLNNDLSGSYAKIMQEASQALPTRGAKPVSSHPDLKFSRNQQPRQIQENKENVSSANQQVNSSKSLRSVAQESKRWTGINGKTDSATQPKIKLVFSRSIKNAACTAMDKANPAPSPSTTSRPKPIHLDG